MGGYNVDPLEVSKRANNLLRYESELKIFTISKIYQNHLATRSDTEKRSEDDINQSCAAAAFTTSNVDSVAAATPESLPASGGQNHGNPFPKQLRMKLRNLKEDIIKLKQKIIWTLTVEDEANQSSATAITTSRDIVNEIGKLPANVSESLPISRGEYLDDSFAEATQKENELGRDQIETDNLVSHTANHLDTVTTRPDTEKKRRRKKRSKDAISQSFSSASRDIVNEINGVHAATVDATPESLPVENLGIPSSTEASQKETETIHDTCGINVEADADEAKSVKSTKKTKSAEEEDTLVVSSDAHNVEPVKAVEGEVPDNIIRTVSGSLKENNAALEVAYSQELSVEVNNAAPEETPLMNNPQDTERNASLLRKCSDHAADKSLYNKSLKEKADDMGDNFGCTQNQEKPDHVAGNNLDGGTNKFSGSVKDILRRSSSYKKALIRAQSQPDIDDDSPLD
ncbi:LOW QUALITY PROTEIN: hypothetical protein HID58_025026 [Brassica napus]|uniref:Shugoshin C-terminal domain-containing protein n=1 Tax=Brassica napus TaxID=3708 RepID=A0ABQ8CJZ0_BRANA|nr:LOW QUALITY PROTEIN: hypothetical protein HID58_025026 [Brassica napus]